MSISQEVVQVKVHKQPVKLAQNGLEEFQRHHRHVQSVNPLPMSPACKSKVVIFLIDRCIRQDEDRQSIGTDISEEMLDVTIACSQVTLVDTLAYSGAKGRGQSQCSNSFIRNVKRRTESVARVASGKRRTTTKATQISVFEMSL